MKAAPFATKAARASRQSRIQAYLYDVLIETDDNKLPDRIVAISLMGLILLNVLAVILETVDDYSSRYAAIFHAVEVFSVGAFTVEYLIRLWIAPLDRRYQRPIIGRLKYADPAREKYDLTTARLALILLPEDQRKATARAQCRPTPVGHRVSRRVRC
jgi:hypothetical protein